MMAQQLHTGHDAILTEGKPFDAMVTCGTEPANTLVALNHRRVFRMVAAVHHGAHLPYLLCPFSFGLAAGFGCSFWSLGFAAGAGG